MARRRILVVDDSAVVRRLLADILSRDPDVEVCGSASDGRAAIDRLRQDRPDLVILDLEMPELDGLETLREIRRSDPRLPVIIYSEHTERGGQRALDALAVGATDVVTKPTASGGPEAAERAILEDLLPRVKALCGASPVWEKRPWTRTRFRVARPQVLAIAASTGGPNALREFFSGLSRGFPAPIVIVQHMPAIFTRILAERLTATGPIPVVEAEPGMALEPGHAVVAPGGFHLVLRRDGLRVVCQTNQDPQVNCCRPSADVTFSSAAEAYGAATLAVVMTGIGQDGLEGCRTIHRLGGRILVQDAPSSVVWGMPGAVAAAGLAEAVLPIRDLAATVLARFCPPPRPPPPATPGQEP